MVDSPWQASPQQVQDYRRHGVVLLRDVFARQWIDRLLALWESVQEHLENGQLIDLIPAPMLEQDQQLQDEIGQMRAAAARKTSYGSGFTGVKWLYYLHEPMRRFVHESPAAQVVGQILEVDEVRFMWDQMFVKKAGTAVPTYWHSDAPAWPTTGTHLPSLWIPLTPIDAELSSLEYIAGSHKGYDGRDWPRTFNAKSLAKPEDRRDFTDYELKRGDSGTHFMKFSMEPGDAVLFDPRLYHGAGSNLNPTIDRIALSTRWIGPDVVWDPRPECVNLPGAPLAQMRRGERPSDEQVFPVVWKREDALAASSA